MVPLSQNFIELAPEMCLIKRVSVCCTGALTAATLKRVLREVREEEEVKQKKQKPDEENAYSIGKMSKGKFARLLIRIDPELR